METNLVIHVRSPSLNETLIVSTNLSATVLSLKESIEPIHPHHPTVENQRIIYSGKLLQDTELLCNIVKNVDDEVAPIFHLVVKPSLQSISQPIPAPVVQPSIPDPVVPETLPQNNTILPVYPPVLPGGYQVVVINGQYYLAPVLVASQPLPQFQHHVSPTYQQPAAHYPTQQGQQPQPSLAAQFQPTQFPPPAGQFQAGQFQPAAAQFEPAQFQPAPEPAQPQGAPVRPANVQRATTIWLALKLAVVLFMLCQGASIERIFIFHIIAFVFFLYQTGRLRFVLRRVRVEDINNRFRPMAQRAPPPIPTQPPTPQQPATMLDTVKRGAYTFFASLWPTYNQDPAQAADNNEQREGLEEF